MSKSIHGKVEKSKWRLSLASAICHLSVSIAARGITFVFSTFHACQVHFYYFFSGRFVSIVEVWIANRPLHQVR